MDILLLYVFTRLDVLTSFAKSGLFCFLIFAVLLAILMGCYATDYRKEDGWAWKNYPKKLIGSIWVFLLCIYLFVPTQKDMAIIVGGTMAVRAAQSETAGKVMQLITQTLDEELEKATSKKGDGK